MAFFELGVEGSRKGSLLSCVGVGSAAESESAMAFMGPGMHGGMQFPGMQQMPHVQQQRPQKMAPPPSNNDKRASWSPSVSNEAKENQAGTCRVPCPANTPSPPVPSIHTLFVYGCQTRPLQRVSFSSAETASPILSPLPAAGS